MSARKLIALGFVTVFAIPIVGQLLIGSASSSWIILLVLAVICIAVIAIVFNHMLNKSPNTLLEELERAQDVIDRAFDGDIDQEFLITRSYIEEQETDNGF